MTKRTHKDHRTIATRFDAGESVERLAREFGLTDAAVEDLLRRPPFDARAWEWNTLARIVDRLTCEGADALVRGEHELAAAFQVERELVLRLLQRITRRRSRR